MENEKTEKTARPASPQPVRPREAKIVNGHDVTFQWKSVEGATAYRLEVAQDTTFDTIVFEKEVSAGSTALTVTDFFPVDEQTYFWRVLARGDGGWSRGERIESFVSGTPEEAAQDLRTPDEAEDYGPLTKLVRSATQMVSDQLTTGESGPGRLEREREQGVAYEGVPSGQILAIAVSILFAVGIIVVLLFQWTSITEAAIRNASVEQSQNTQLRETQLQADQKLTGYEVLDEEAGVYRIPIERAMELMATEAYQEGDQTYSPEAPFAE